MSSQLHLSICVKSHVTQVQRISQFILLWNSKKLPDILAYSEVTHRPLPWLDNDSQNRSR